jgi:Holliday junction resolvase RusA-like endonuclease
VLQAISLEIPAEMVTKGSTAFKDAASAERMRIWQEAFWNAVQSWPHRQQLHDWFETRKRMALSVEFHLTKARAASTDIDNLLKDLFDQLTAATYGMQPDGKTKPNMKDCLFWRLNASKALTESGKVLISIEPLAP